MSFFIRMAATWSGTGYGCLCVLSCVYDCVKAPRKQLRGQPGGCVSCLPIRRASAATLVRLCLVEAAEKPPFTAPCPSF